VALHIRDERALHLAKQLAAAKGVTMTQAVVDALEEALARAALPLEVRLAEIARDARRMADPARMRRVDEQEVDELWGNP
jgi:antitoxin VapB